MKSKVYTGTFRAPRMNFTADLYDRSSDKYKRMKMNFGDSVRLGWPNAGTYRGENCSGTYKCTVDPTTTLVQESI